MHGDVKDQIHCSICLRGGREGNGLLGFNSIYNINVKCFSNANYYR